MAKRNAWNEAEELYYIKDKLLELQIHNCYECKKTLRKPIMTDPDNGWNYCFSCKTGDNLKRNETLEDILNKLTIPCVYKTNGCTELVNYSALESHEEVCIKRKFHCPLKWSADCKWEGPTMDILGHCYELHDENVIEAQENLRLNVEIGLKEMVVIKQCKVFIVRLVHTHNKKTSCQVYIVGETEKSGDFSFVMNYCKKRSQKVIPFVAFKQKIDLTGTYIIENTNGNKINLSIFVSDVGLDENLLTFFECPVCHNIMRPPIFLCTIGHSICQSCKPKLPYCGICRNQFSNARNYSLEAICSKVPIPCMNQEKGCGKLSWTSEIDLHEDECSFRNYTCPLQKHSNCSWSDNLTVLPEHLKSNHYELIRSNDYQYFSTYHSSNCLIKCPKLKRHDYCVFVFGQVFRFSYRDNHGYDPKWSVTFIGPKRYAKKFEYKIELVDQALGSKIAGMSSLCQEMNSTPNTTDAGVSICRNVVDWMAENEKIVYYCRIRQLPG